VTSNNREKLRAAVRFFYDLQKLRIASLHRSEPKKGEAPKIILDEDDKKYIDLMGKGIKKLERDALKEITRIASQSVVYEYLIGLRGVGPTIAGFLISEFDITRSNRPSQFWAFAGLHVEDGKSPRPHKGEKLKWNKWLRAKCVFVLGGALIKSNNAEYRELYDNYKHRKVTQLGECRPCKGTGKATSPESKKSVKCWNCVGNKNGEYTPDRAPWGQSDAHRHQASVRYMVKQFLADLWREWRTREGLPVVPTYHEAKQGYVHGGDPLSSGEGIQAKKAS
jgi:hypothetical protein